MRCRGFGGESQKNSSPPLDIKCRAGAQICERERIPFYVFIRSQIGWKKSKWWYQTSLLWYKISIIDSQLFASARKKGTISYTGRWDAKYQVVRAKIIHASSLPYAISDVDSPIALRSQTGWKKSKRWGRINPCWICSEPFTRRSDKESSDGTEAGLLDKTSS